MATNCAAEAGEGVGAAFLWTDEVIAGPALVQESGSTGGEAGGGRGLGKMRENRDLSQLGAFSRN